MRANDRPKKQLKTDKQTDIVTTRPTQPRSHIGHFNSWENGYKVLYTASIRAPNKALTCSIYLFTLLANIAYDTVCKNQTSLPLAKHLIDFSFSQLFKCPIWIGFDIQTGYIITYHACMSSNYLEIIMMYNVFQCTSALQWILNTSPPVMNL